MDKFWYIFISIEILTEFSMWLWFAWEWYGNNDWYIVVIKIMAFLELEKLKYIISEPL